MSWIENLLFTPSVAHSLVLVALVIAIGLYLSRIKIGGISIGVTWILFVGIVFGHFGLVLDATTSHFVKELKRTRSIDRVLSCWWSIPDSNR